jgi:hypothetical protein
MCDAGSWIWCRQLVLRTEIDDIPIIPAAGLNVGSDWWANEGAQDQGEDRAGSGAHGGSARTGGGDTTAREPAPSGASLRRTVAV